MPLLATTGSVAGAALTFWMGVKIGEQGLERYVPPPFPFTLFVLAAGALKVKAQTFFVTLAAFRMVRFGLEAALAIIFGRRIVAWLDADRFHDIVLGVIVLAVALTAMSLVRVVRSTRASAGEMQPRTR